MQDILAGLKASSSTADPSYVSEVVCLLEDSDAEMLKASATLHAIGMAIGFRDYNHHSNYLIKVAFHPIISQCENNLFWKKINGDIVSFFLVLFLCEVKCRTMTFLLATALWKWR